MRNAGESRGLLDFGVGEQSPDINLKYLGVDVVLGEDCD